MPKLFEEATGWAANNFGGGATYNFGSVCEATQEITVTHVAWRRPASGSTGKPAKLQLWTHPGTTLLEEITTGIVDAETVGWHQTPLVTPVTLAATDKVMASAFWNGNTNASVTLHADRGNDPTGAVSQAQGSQCAYGGSGTTKPGSSSAQYIYGVAAVFELGGGEPTPPAEPPEDAPPAGSATLNSSLAYWLDDRTVNPNSLPLQIKDDLTDFAAIQNAAMATATASIGIAAGTNANTILGRLALLLPLIEAASAIASNISNIISNTDDGPTQHEELLILANNIYTHHLYDSGRARIPISDPAWMAVYDTSGAGASTWDVAADAYVFTITNPETLQPRKVINGLPYQTHIGFWCPLDVDIAGDYRTFVSNKQMFIDPGRRLPGVLFYVDPGIEWTLQAFDFVPSP